MSKPKPYCARTLRHAARLASDTAGQYRSLAAQCPVDARLFHMACGSTLAMLSALLKKEASAIERKAPKPICGPHWTKKGKP